jgi:hypothetical protein
MGDEFLPEKVKMVFAWIDLSDGPMFLRECMERQGIEDHDVLFGEFIHAGYRLDYPGSWRSATPRVRSSPWSLLGASWMFWALMLSGGRRSRLPSRAVAPSCQSR